MAPGKKTSVQPVLSQSLFSTAYLPQRGWRSYITSTALHGALILALLLVTFPAIRNEVEKQRVDKVTLIAPVIPRYEAKLPPPAHVNLPQPPRDLARVEPRPKLLPPVKPVVVKQPDQVKPLQVAAAPEIKREAVAPPTPIPEVKTPLPPAPKPAVRTGSFQAADAALAPREPRIVKVGGFGDPNGVAPSQNSNNSSQTMARVGSFDLPAGAGNAGGGGRSSAGGVRQTSFGSAGEPGGAHGGVRGGGGTVHTGGFGEGVTAPSQIAANARTKPAIPAFTPVEILSKPKPTYSTEARSLRLEGEVSLDVVFLSTGSIRIIRVAHGLGHGLDEAAEEAAMHVRFRPATRDGVPVDSSATIRITFQLT